MKVTMQVYNEKQDFCLKNTAVTLGKFDGVHIGHQKLISAILEEKEKNGYETVLFSFDTSVIRQQNSLTTKKERMLLGEELGIEHMILYPVNQDTMGIEPEAFIRDILVGRLGAKVVVTGKDFCFGKGRRGNVEMLQKYAEPCGYRLKVVPNVTIDGERVSSSNIKVAIREGRMEDAAFMLGHPYFVCGAVVRGNQIGRTMDARTVNVIPGENKVLMPNGVYKTGIIIDGVRYKSVTNVGFCPTVRADDRITIETNVFNFDRDIYDTEVKIEFERFMREERKFATLDELKQQILLDISQANL
ncbi:MAG: bifunctional riboflavin kinase/FAD synthetase [Lachnospiraceae bacterium]|nr:bifunctional riboflavin kinase/FAD synthetase [Lachnospiraceae bacterium]